MKKSEQEALKDAFNIPEPERKADFLREFESKMQEKEKEKTFKPIIRMNKVFRYSSIAALAVLVIGIWGKFTLSPDFFDKFKGQDDIPPAVTTTTAETTAAPTTIITAQSTGTVTKSIRTTQEKSSETTEPVSTKTSIGHIQTTAKITFITTAVQEYRPPVTSANSTSGTAVRTTAAGTTVSVNSTSTSGKTTHSASLTTTRAFLYTTTTKSDLPVFTSPPETYPPGPVATELPPMPVTSIPPINSSVPPGSETIPSSSTQTVTTQNGKPGLIGEYYSDPPTHYLRDFCVETSVRYDDPDDYVKLSDLGISLPGGDAPGCSPPDNESRTKQLKHMIEKSDIICGAIPGIYSYTNIGQQIYTQTDLFICNLYKGDMFKSADGVSMFVKGGYMPIDDFFDSFGIENHFYLPSYYYVYDSGMIRDSRFDIGKYYTFFLEKNDVEEVEGSFVPFGGDPRNIFCYNDETGCYESISDEKMYFDIVELTTILRELNLEYKINFDSVSEY